jgi:hypothetical protein
MTPAAFAGRAYQHKSGGPRRDRPSPCHFRALAADGSEAERAAVVERFPERVHAALVAQPGVAAVWHAFSLHLVRRRRVGAASDRVVR